ncbi:MAG: hypothetical protein SPL08_04970 [Pseudomonadota bacterium]|nr:hypothetical protein [Pseudomonadota bacterium]
MSISDRLKKVAMMGALGASLIAPQARAQQAESIGKAPDRIEQSATTNWTWGTDAHSMHAKAVYDSLPAEYKAFAGKSFMERFEMKEEWEQRDFLKRDHKRSAILRQNPNATIRDFSPNTSIPNLKLANFPTGEGSYDLKIIQEQAEGKLTYEQAMMAQDMINLGRPLATVNKNMSYADQLKECGLDIMARVANGTRLHDLSARDMSIFVAQDQNAERLNDQNADARRDLRIRLAQEDVEEMDKNSSFLGNLFATKTRRLTEEETKGKFPTETLNGKVVGIRQPNEVTYSIHDEITRKVAGKIDIEEKEASIRMKNARTDR